jgi:hypothetical protein
MNGKSQMQEGKNWILTKEISANRFLRDSHWLEILKNHLLSLYGTELRERGLSWIPASEGRNRIRSKSQKRIILMACFDYIYYRYSPFRKLHLFSCFFHDKISKALHCLTSRFSFLRGEKSPVRPGDNGERVRLPGGVAAG